MNEINVVASNLRDRLGTATAELKGISHSPRLDAEVLMAHVLKVDRSYLISHADTTLSFESNAQFEQMLALRKTGKPIAYILGKKGFWTFELEIDENTLVPRPETELLVEQALKLLPDDQVLAVADICTGSGAIALAIASERPHVSIDATDIDQAALMIAHKNRDTLKLDNVDFFCGDLFAPLTAKHKKYDMLVSNPPYIDKDDAYLTHPTMQHEPRHALIAEDNGLALITQLIEQCHAYLTPGGYLILEHGHEQRAAIESLCKQHHLKYTLGCQDYQALDRISIIQSPTLEP